MHADRPRPATSPYLLERPPASDGRVLLSRAFEHYCLLHRGLSGEEIAAAFAGAGEERSRDYVGMAAALLGGVLARGLVRTWARPFGGGESVELRPTAWELDHFEARFATSALDPGNLFDPAAPPTHWIFVDLDGWNELLEASVGDVVPRPRRSRLASRATTVAGEVLATPRTPATTAPASRDDSLLRLPEIKRRTGLSRSTIYRKMEAGHFPQSLPLSENTVGWRERDVAEWVSNPT